MTHNDASCQRAKTLILMIVLFGPASRPRACEINGVPRAGVVLHASGPVPLDLHRCRDGRQTAIKDRRRRRPGRVSIIVATITAVGTVVAAAVAGALRFIG